MMKTPFELTEISRLIQKPTSNEVKVDQTLLPTKFNLTAPRTLNGRLHSNTQSELPKQVNDSKLQQLKQLKALADFLAKNDKNNHSANEIKSLNNTLHAINQLIAKQS